MDIKKLFRFGVGTLVGGLLPVLAGLVLLFMPFGKSLVNLSYSLLFAPRAHINVDDVVIVYLDDQSHAQLKQSYIEPWDRDLHARLLHRLKEDGAKAVVFDIVFSDPMTNNPARDARLAQAIKDNGKVCLAADAVPAGEGVAGSTVKLPFEALLEGAATVGTVEMRTDDDFIVRGLYPGDPNELVSSMGWATAEWLGAQVTTGKDDEEKKAKKYAERWINYYGPPRHIPGVSYFKAVSDEAGVRTPPGFFKDKIVYVGAHIITYLQGERKDEYRSPYSFWLAADAKSLFMPGVEIQATIFLNFWRGDWLTRLPRQEEGMILIGLGLLFGVGLVHLRPIWASLTALVSIVAISCCAYLAFKHSRVWTPWLVVAAAQIPLATVWSILFNSINLYVAKRLMEQSLSMYVSPARVKQIAKNPKILQPGAEKQELSILFSDIANFTSMSEGMDTDQLAKLMNNYFETTVSQCIDPAQGTVVKFIGDAIFAIWNAPEPQPNHQELACRGALLLRDSTSKFKFDKPGLEVRTRIGLHSGTANVGNFGSTRRVDYTALGENINLASRMEGLNKYLGTDVLITGDIYSSVKDKFVTRFAGRFQLKGFEKEVVVHELLSESAQAEESRPWREAYAEALKSFEKGDLDAAEAQFRKVLEIRPKDGPSQFLLKHIKEVRAHPHDGDWTGIVELKEK